jgi:hypothetical protein
MDKKQRKIIRRQIRLQKKVVKQQNYLKDLPKYGICIAGYFDDEGVLRRIGGTLVHFNFQTFEDKPIDRKEIWLESIIEIDPQEEIRELTEEELQKLTDVMDEKRELMMAWIDDMISKHNIEEKDLIVSHLEEPVPLEECKSCDCGFYLDQVMTSRGFLELQKQGSRH